ncbi:cytochrome P450 [Macrophomina phaseolina]|uniref:Cytochrome P450 n=1 Tax=Macrophomina phaseolina TaxID=35725 RepID=A0ABQ8G1I1_9PEZI|nr:cytochrome P450 [Macrophomina phaseolina]
MLNSISWPSNVALVVVVLLLYRYFTQGEDKLAHVPRVRFEKGGNSIRRYFLEADKLLHDGYIKYIKNEQPFRLRSAIDPTKQVVVLPLKYLPEVKTATQDKISFPKFSEESFRVQFNHGPKITEEAQNSMKAELPKNLAPMIESLQDASAIAIHNVIPECKDWTKVRPMEAIILAIIRMAHRAFAGPDLGTSQEWVDTVRDYLQRTNDAIVSSNLFFPGPLGYLAPYIDPNVRAVARIKLRFAELLKPTYEQRLMVGRNGKEETDGLDWLITAAKKGPKTIDGMVNDLGFLTIASVETTASTTLNIIYDLLDRPDDYEKILDEIKTVQDANGTRWTKKALDELELLDSFMKESQRLRPLGMGLYTLPSPAQVSPTNAAHTGAVHRSTKVDYTFKDGFTIPADTQILFPTHEICHDDDFYPDAATFDAERFLRMRRTIDRNKFQFSYISDQYITFGAGSHACPGRAFASAEIKLMLVHILQRWEIRYAAGKRPAPVHVAFSRIPDAKADLLFKEKESWRAACH